jgi:hypothetical protein
MPEEQDHQPKTQLPEILIGTMVTGTFDAVEVGLFLFGVDDFWVTDVLFGGTLLAYTFLRGLPPVPNLAGTGIEGIPYVGGLFPGRTAGFLTMAYIDHNPNSKLAKGVKKVASVTASYKGGGGAAAATRPSHAPASPQGVSKERIRSTPQEKIEARKKSEKPGEEKTAAARATQEKVPAAQEGQRPKAEKEGKENAKKKEGEEKKPPAQQPSKEQGAPEEQPLQENPDEEERGGEEAPPAEQPKQAEGGESRRETAEKQPQEQRVAGDNVIPFPAGKTAPSGAPQKEETGRAVAGGAETFKKAA